MTAVQSLFDDLVVYPDVTGLSLQERFEAFHAANPWVYRRLVEMSRAWKRRGRSRIGIAMLIETLRWQYGMMTTGDEFYLNNSYRSRYSRMIMANEDDLDGFFSTRELRS